MLLFVYDGELEMNLCVLVAGFVHWDCYIADHKREKLSLVGV